ncbi:MAG: hypothetical protein WD114_07025, partial [Phycisphaerales bacterium]
MQTSKPAFTLMETGIVMVIVALIAVVVVPRLASAGDDPQARAQRAADDLKEIAATFRAYRATHGYWPPEAPTGQMPPEMRSQFSSANPFAAPTPLGGRYDYDHFKDQPAICIAIRTAPDSPAPSIADAQMLDAIIDDGVLSTGNFRTSVQGGYVYA